MATALRAGFAVANYAALEPCRAIWISVPEAELDYTVRDLAAQTPLHRTMIVICGSERESGCFGVLREHGARVLTLNEVGQSRQRLFVGEGNAGTLRMVRKVLEADGRRMVEVRTGAKAAYLAGVHMATELLRPWTVAAIGCLQSAGMARPEAAAIVEHLAERAVRSHSRVGEKPWGETAEAELRRVLETRAEELYAREPREAQLYAAGVRLTLDYFGSQRARRKAAGQHA